MCSWKNLREVPVFVMLPPLRCLGHFTSFQSEPAESTGCPGFVLSAFTVVVSQSIFLHHYGFWDLRAPFCPQFQNFIPSFASVLCSVWIYSLKFRASAFTAYTYILNFYCDLNHAVARTRFVLQTREGNKQIYMIQFSIWLFCVQYIVTIYLSHFPLLFTE